MLKCLKRDSERMIRLDKYLSDSGVGTRSEVREYCKKGWVTVDGSVCRNIGQKIEPGRMVVCFRGNTVIHEADTAICYMLNKPAGYLCAARDSAAQTVFDLMPDVDPDRFFSVGRLDKDSEGLLLITNDGALSHKLTSPRMHVPKTYEVWISGTLTGQELKSLSEGTDIGDDTPCLPAQVAVLHTEPVYRLSREERMKLPSSLPEVIEADHVRITIYEGRYHQVKRMFHANRHEVFRLKRTAVGALCLDQSLGPGAYRRLTAEELEQLTAEINR